MSKYGLRIKNIEAAVLYEYNLGLRKRLDYTKAMFSNSLLLDYLLKIGLRDNEGKSTQDIICLCFNFGCLSYEGQKKRIESKIKKYSGCDKKSTEFYKNLLEHIEANKDSYREISAEELREYYYKNGVSVTYKYSKNRKETIHYRMLFRSAGKAKLGQVMFINEDLYDDALNWIRMGIKLPDENALITEIGAYSSLTASSIVDRIHIDPKHILILKDVDSFMQAPVAAVETNEQNECIVRMIDEYRLKNTMFDGQALIDSSIFPEWGNGFILLRHHMFKAAAFNTHIQRFMQDYFGEDYDDALLVDMFGNEIPARDVLLITTENALKCLKFDVPVEYWHEWVRENGALFGIVKTAHPSKFGEFQRMSYQMVNSLDLSTMEGVMQASVDHVDRMKNDDDFFLEWLEKNISYENDFACLVDLCKWNRDFIKCDYFRERKYKIISNYIRNVKSGKLLQYGDNFTICGSGFALLMHSVGEDPLKDPTFNTENGAIQCYCERFDDGEYLADFRSPHNHFSNIGYLHNIKHPYLKKYMDIGTNCIVVNMNGTSFQDKHNGSDQDGDQIYVTNTPEIVAHAADCIQKYPVIVNKIPKDKNRYKNTPEDFARVDNALAEANSAIGLSSNLAQLCLTYSFNFNDSIYNDNACILSVVAQAAIDNCKRRYNIDLNKEIARIKDEINVDENGKPLFWFYRKEKSRFSKKAKKEGKQLMKGYQPSLVCPMNYVCTKEYPRSRRIDERIPFDRFIIRRRPEAPRRKNKKIEELIEKFRLNVYAESLKDDDDYDDFEIFENEMEDLIAEIKNIYLGYSYQGLMCYLINRAFSRNTNKRNSNSNLNRNRALLLNILHKLNRETFLSCFIPNGLGDSNA